MIIKKQITNNIDFINNLILTISFLFLANKTLTLFIFNVSIDGLLKSIFFKISLFSLLFAILIIFFSFTYSIRLNKYIIYLIVFLSLSTDYFMRSFGVLLDETLFQSLFESSTNEALQYYHFSYFIEVGICLISFIFIYQKLKFTDFTILNTLKTFFQGLGLSVLIVFIVGVFFYKDCASFFRNNRSVRHLVNPINTLYQSYNYINFLYSDKTTTFVQISDDAKMTTTKKPKLFVFILGETARSSNFSINGYARNTNPNLIKENNLVNFENVTSCGTATAISVPCLFSDKNRSEFNRNKDMKRENIIDILNKVGFNSTWVENNTGCKGVCDRITNFDLATLKNNEICNVGGCYDEILVNAFNKIIDQPISKTAVQTLNNQNPKPTYGNQAIYLHMLGSHGPTYYLRYPDKFGEFKPVCNSSKLSDCTSNSIINTYDNTILYTEHIISEVIKKLKASPQYDSVLVYVSDHGESLGERGVYLHSLPYIIAPKEQKQIPFFFWFSDSYYKNESVRINNIKNKTKCSLSHDNVFHSLIGAFKIKSKFHDNTLDIFNEKFKCLKK